MKRTGEFRKEDVSVQQNFIVDLDSLIPNQNKEISSVSPKFNEASINSFHISQIKHAREQGSMAKLKRNK